MEFLAESTESNEAKEQQQDRYSNWERCDFVATMGLPPEDALTRVGVYLPADKEAPILIAEAASETFAKYSAVHEVICQRSEPGDEYEGLECSEVEAVVLDIMVKEGVLAEDIRAFVADRAEMFSRLLANELPDTMRADFSRSLHFLEAVAESY